MKRIIIICEGPTEREFCKDVLVPFFSLNHIFIDSPIIKKSGGGIVPWRLLKKEIENHMKQDSGVWVTTFFDYYGIPEKFNYPCWEEAHHERNKNLRLKILEKGMIKDLEAEFQCRFIPYIHLHEFEGLLFNDINVFSRNFDRSEFNDFRQFQEVFRQFPNPEDINDDPVSAPSKRLQHHIKGYDKIIYGALLAADIGLTRIREKCPRFNEWINILENC